MRRADPAGPPRSCCRATGSRRRRAGARRRRERLPVIGGPHVIVAWIGRPLSRSATPAAGSRPSRSFAPAPTLPAGPLRASPAFRAADPACPAAPRRGHRPRRRARAEGPRGPRGGGPVARAPGGARRSIEGCPHQALARQDEAISRLRTALPCELPLSARTEHSGRAASEWSCEPKPKSRSVKRTGPVGRFPQSRPGKHQGQPSRLGRRTPSSPRLPRSGASSAELRLAVSDFHSRDRVHGRARRKLLRANRRAALICRRPRAARIRSWLSSSRTGSCSSHSTNA